jgi:hypothetical protein
MGYQTRKTEITPKGVKAIGYRINDDVYTVQNPDTGKWNVYHQPSDGYFRSSKGLGDFSKKGQADKFGNLIIENFNMGFDNEDGFQEVNPDFVETAQHFHYESLI